MTATAVTGMTQIAGHTKANIRQLQIKTKGFWTLLSFKDLQSAVYTRTFYQTKVQPSLFCEGTSK